MSKRSTKDHPYATLLGVAEQGLLDLAASGASDVVFVRERRSPPGPFLDALEELALGLDFVVASIAVGAEHGFDALDDVVRGFAKSLRAGDSDERGLVSLLDAFATREKRRAVERFDEQAEEVGATGDLARLCRAYLVAKGEPRAELRSLRAYLEGRDPSKAALEETSSRLVARTAKRTLADLSRVVRALGHAGLLLVARRAGSLAELSPARRENAYTVLRELCDNADGPRGSLSMRLVVSGSDELFEGPRSMLESAPLTTRVLFDDADDEALAPLPHATVLQLPDRTVDAPDSWPVREAEAPSDKRARAVSALVRASMGLPPLHHLDDLTVGYEAIDETVDRLFEHASNEGSVFSLLSGAYGSGKTHLLMHVTARALAERRPVFRLSVESLDADLGNPQRHLRRLIEGALLPGAGAPSPLDRLAAWTRTEASKKKLARELESVVSSESEAATAGRRALRALES
ncbi:MAG TPA: BREX system ATP-binding domain-containing protein, partial [Polyangiaceae bacterium]|nr:BREX system ATP-binding domain-containing protein [Polyangiaceae bacterium]